MAPQLAFSPINLYYTDDMVETLLFKSLICYYIYILFIFLPFRFSPVFIYYYFILMMTTPVEIYQKVFLSKSVYL